jgi:hypothetical protein
MTDTHELEASSRGATTVDRPPRKRASLPMGVLRPYCNGRGRIIQVWTDDAGRELQREVDCPACRSGHTAWVDRTAAVESRPNKWWQFWRRS